MRIRRRIAWGLLVLAFLGVVGTIGGFYAAGYRAYMIHTGSMHPTLKSGDLIIDRPADGHYQLGDIITFQSNPTDGLVTHRIVGITAEGIHTKGDANRTADVWTIPRNHVEGVVAWTLPGVAYAVVFLKQPTGLASLLAMLVGLVLLWQLFFPPTKSAATAADDRDHDEDRDHPAAEAPQGRHSAPDEVPEADGVEPTDRDQRAVVTAPS